MTSRSPLKRIIIATFFIFSISLAAHSADAADAKQTKPIKVFILAGQSNMQGHGYMHMGKDGDLDYAAKQPPFNYLKKDSDWNDRKDVWYYHMSGKGQETKDTLKIGMGAAPKSIGPELGFGHVLGNYYSEPILLIKCAWGGQALGQTFLPPSSKLPDDTALKEQLAKVQKKNPKATLEEIKASYGSKYRQVITEVNGVLKNLKKHFPQYKDQGYEIAGFFWHQGWNDGCSKAHSQSYEVNMTNFIKDMRKDLGNDKLPFVIATSGMGGPDATGVAGWLGKGIEPKQIAASKKNDFCTAVPTRHFQKHKPGRQKSHWHNSAESYLLLGDASGKAMVEILKQYEKAKAK